MLHLLDIFVVLVHISVENLDFMTKPRLETYRGYIK